MKILHELLADLPEGEVVDVRVGLHWTAVVVQVGDERRCGLSSTLSEPHEHGGEPDVPQAGRLEAFTGRQLAELSLSAKPTLRSIGVAAINALISKRPEVWMDGNAEGLIADRGRGLTVVMVGRFPFARRLKPIVGELLVLEQDPGPEDLPEETAPDVLPRADFVALTAMALVNGTLEPLLSLCPPAASVMLVGPSAPLSEVLFEHRIDIIAGSAVTAIEPVVRAVGQGAGFRQVHKAGVRLVSMARPGLDLAG